MEIMEEGNMMDRVRILLQRDMDYYQANQTVLQENICPGVVGGLLDFPHYASFAAYKMVLWWEEEYVAAFMKGSGLIEACTDPEGEPIEDKGCGGVVKTSAPADFVSVTSTSASQLLEHLHMLSQEALDHADLTVLTGTLGAAALVKNCLWCYNEQLKKTQDIEPPPSLHVSHKQYHEMAEALAERLLDLHCRLLSLYVLQDAECLNWENPKPFFEGERGSFIVQMWWLYMQGTKEDLWNTVPPKMAQRVLAGMLNESLTILTVRYTQAQPSSARSPLLIADVTDILLCVRQLLPAICNNAEELYGHAPRNKVIKDVHAKCHQLLLCLLFRGCPLAMLYKVFCKGSDELAMCRPMQPGAPAVWFMLTSPHLFGTLPTPFACVQELPDGPAIALELSVLVAQPQASWPLLIRVLMLRNCKVINLILGQVMKASQENYTEKMLQFPAVAPGEGIAAQSVGLVGQCGGFLCSGGGDCSLGCSPDATELPPGVVVKAVVHVLVEIGGPNDFANTLLPALEKTKSWGSCLDRRQVWNQCRPPWLDALLQPLQPIIAPVVHTVNRAMNHGANINDATSLALDSLIQLIDILPTTVVRSSFVLEDAIAADVRPMAGSVLLQWLLTELYSHLVKSAGNMSMALAESLCSLDENKKHQPKIQQFLQVVKESADGSGEDFNKIEDIPYMAEVLVSKLLLTSYGRRALKVLWQYLQYTWLWITGQLGALEAELEAPDRPPPIPAKASRPRPTRLLHTMFHMGYTNLDCLNWKGLLQTNLSLTREQIWMQLQWRADFREPTAYLNQHDQTVVKTLTQLFEKEQNK